MGSFDYTCTISNLPIGCGTKVRYLFLASYKNTGHVVYSNDSFEPIIAPIKGEYNDYGSIESYDSNDVMIKVLSEFMKHHVVEAPVGNNEYHDVRVDRDMPFDKWLEATWEGRVSIRKNPFEDKEYDFYRYHTSQDGVPGKYGAPNRRRLEAQLLKMGEKMFKNYGDGGLIVDDPFFGCSRIRIGESGDHKERIQDLKTKLSEEYNIIMIPGTNHWNIDILLFPYPNEQNNPNRDASVNFDIAETFSDKNIPICQGMVREDVYQYLLTMGIESYYYKDTSLKFFYNSAKKLWDAQKQTRSKSAELKAKVPATEEEAADIKSELMVLKYEEKISSLTDENNPVANFLEISSGSYSWFRKAWKYALDMDLTKEEQVSFHKQMAEICRVCFAIGSIRYAWQRGHSVGEQVDDCKNHVPYYKFLMEVAHKEYFEAITERDEIMAVKPKAKPKKKVRAVRGKVYNVTLKEARAAVKKVKKTVKPSGKKPRKKIHYL